MKHRPSILAVLLLLSSVAVAQKPTLKPEDYKQWESLSSPQLSPDGRWLAYGVNLVDGDGRVVIRNVDSAEKWEVPVGGAARFSDNSAWVAYSIGVPKKEAEKLVEQKKQPRNKLGLRSLPSGEEQVFEDVQSFSFLDGSKFLVMQRYRGEGKTVGGSDLVVLNLQNGAQVAVGNVAGWTPNERHTLLALQVESDSGFEGVQIFNPATSSIKPLHWSKNDVSGLTWAEERDVLAFYVGRKDEKKEGNWNVIVLASNLDAEKPTFQSFDPEKVKEFPAGKRVAEFGPLWMTKDASSIAFGIRDWGDKKAPAGKPEDKPGVEVWHSKDLSIVPQQKRQLPFESRQTELCVWRPGEDLFVQLNPKLEYDTVMLTRDQERAVLVHQKPYESSVTPGVNHRDVWVMNVRDGARAKLLEKTVWSPSLSREGRYLAYFHQKAWWVHDLNTGTATNITKGLKTSFENQEFDGTTGYTPPVGGATWLADDSGVFVYDNYDTYLWRTGMPRAEPLTDGYKQKLMLRPLSPDPTDEDGIRIDKPIYFSIFDKVNKGSGFYLHDSKGGSKPLIFMEKGLGGLRKAENADRMIFSISTFTESPTVYVTNGAFSEAKPMTKLNAQQENFAWGKAELIHFKNKWGVELQGTLIYPADYQPGRRYPMITYIYERLSNGFHNYQAPSEWSAYNSQVFSQNGYFVLMPDIVYRPRHPGKSAVEALEPAVDAALKACRDIDPKRVGLVGHSWGGYQTTFVISQTDKFSAAVAGAPLTNLISMYGSIYWNSGTPDQELLETGQGRLEVPYWEDLKAYMENSALFNASKINAPLLVAFGDQDGAVDWHQGQELYTTMRRLGKNMILLVYPGENHGLARRPNQLDYAHRVRHFFDVYLKGSKPEPWVTEGVKFGG